MKGVLTCLAVTLILSFVTVVLMNQWWSLVPVAGAAGAAAMVGYAAFVVRDTSRRDARVRELVCTALASGAEVARLKDLVQVLGTPDVVRARRDHLRAEAETLAIRYANGEASDY